jgi:uncharacterized protein (TIGR00251 family)
VRAAGADVLLDVWATPGAARSEVAGVAEGRLRLRLAAPAREGRANAELVRLVAQSLGVSRRDVSVVRGTTGRRKTIRVAGASPADVAARLGL